MIKAIITDFDGTLIDTRQANLLAYKEAFEKCGVTGWEDEKYNEYYGLNFKDLCSKFISIRNDKNKQQDVKTYKKMVYPLYFNRTKFNHTLYDMIKSQHDQGVITGIASTASYENIHNLLHYISDNIIFSDIYKDFDFILTAEDVKNGKPAPDVYLTAYDKILEINKDIYAEDVLIFEDSDYGMQAAEAADINYMKIKI